MTTITQCPREVLDEEVAQVLLLADLFKKGVPPIAGGALDQAQAFLDAALFVWSEQAAWQAEGFRP